MALDAKTLEQVQGVAALVTQYGVPMVQQLVTNIGSKNDPTAEEIEALADDLKDLDSYFEDDPAPEGSDPA